MSISFVNWFFLLRGCANEKWKICYSFLKFRKETYENVTHVVYYSTTTTRIWKEKRKEIEKDRGCVCVYVCKTVSQHPLKSISVIYAAQKSRKTCYSNKTMHVFILNCLWRDIRIVCWTLLYELGQSRCNKIVLIDND